MKKKTVKAWAVISKETGNLINVWTSEPSEYEKANPKYIYIPCTITYSL